EGSGAEPPEDRFAGEPYRLQHLLASGPFHGSGRQSAAQSPHQIGGPASLGLRGMPALPGGLPAHPPDGLLESRAARVSPSPQPSALRPQSSVLSPQSSMQTCLTLCPLPSTSWQLLAGTAYDPSMSTTDDDRSRLAAESPDFLAGSLADDAPEDPCVLVDVWQDDAFIRRSEHGDLPDPTAVVLSTVAFDAEGTP